MAKENTSLQVEYVPSSEDTSSSRRAGLVITEFVENNEYDETVEEAKRFPRIMIETANNARARGNVGLPENDKSGWNDLVYNHVVIQSRGRASERTFVEMHGAYSDFELLEIPSSETSRPSTYSETVLVNVQKAASYELDTDCDYLGFETKTPFVDSKGKILTDVEIVLESETNTIYFKDSSGVPVIVSVVLKALRSYSIEYYYIRRTEFLNIDADITFSFDSQGNLLEEVSIDRAEMGYRMYIRPFIIVLRSKKTGKVLDSYILSLKPIVTFIGDGSDSDAIKAAFNSALENSELGSSVVTVKVYEYSVNSGHGSIKTMSIAEANEKGYTTTVAYSEK